MNTPRLFLASLTACALASATVGACASVESPVSSEPNDAAPPPDGALDAPKEAEAGPCADREYFPEQCSPDVLCSNGPFDPVHPTAGLDWRTRINVIRGRSESDVSIAGALGALAHFDGTSWTRSDPGSSETLLGLWLRGDEEITFASLRNVYARGLDVPDRGDAGPPSAGGWRAYADLPAPPDFNGVAAEITSTWAAPGVEQWWCTTTTSYAGMTSGLWRLRVTPSTGFEVGVGILTDVCTSLGCTQMNAVHGSSANVLWAVGLNGATMRITNATSDTPNVKAFNSKTWNALRGVWAASESEAWSVGALGTIRHYDSDPIFWEVVTDVPTTVDLNSVWGTSSSDIWAVGNLGVVLHYDGTSWSRVKIAGLGERRPDLFTVWSPSPGHVWIGGRGVLLSLGGRP